MKIGIILGSIREERSGQTVAEWVAQESQARQDATYELVDLKSFDVPLLTSATVPGAADKKYDSEQVTRWSGAIDSYDGFIFVTPEYNHGVPGGFKNAVDSLGSEWNGKVLGLVGYGAVGGVRAVEQWRLIMANFSQTVVRAAVDLSIFTDFADGAVIDSDPKVAALNGVLDEVIAAGA